MVGDRRGVSAGERQLLCNFRSVHIPARIRRAFSWISLCFVFFCMLLNKTPWDQRSINKQSSGVQERINPFYIVSYGENCFGLRTFRVTNGIQERIKLVNRGSTVLPSTPRSPKFIFPSSYLVFVFNVVPPFSFSLLTFYEHTFIDTEGHYLEWEVMFPLKGTDFSHEPAASIFTVE
jgi:hypothetical protein